LDREGDPDQEFSPIVIMERGGCTFVRKARNVQELGGALTIVIDNRDYSSPESLIMIDDGTGTSIAIPTILISKEDGKKIMKAVQATEAENLPPGALKKFVIVLVDFLMVR
jgi:hypothetical protein